MWGARPANAHVKFTLKPRTNIEYIKAKIQSEDAKFRAIEMACTALETTPAMLKFLTAEIIIAWTAKVDWFEIFLQLQSRFEQKGSDWFIMSHDSPNHNAIKKLQTLFPDVVEIAALTEEELESITRATS